MREYYRAVMEPIDPEYGAIAFGPEFATAGEARAYAWAFYSFGDTSEFEEHNVSHLSVCRFRSGGPGAKPEDLGEVYAIHPDDVDGEWSYDRFVRPRPTGGSPPDAV